MGHLYTSSSPALTNSSGVSTPRVRNADDFRVGVRYSRADLRLERREGMVVIRLFRSDSEAEFFVHRRLLLVFAVLT